MRLFFDHTLSPTPELPGGSMEIVEIADLKTLRTCARLFTEVNNAPPWNDEWTVDRSVRRLTDIFNGPGFFGIAGFVDERIVGFILGNVEVFYDCEHFCLREMAVAGGEQRQGVGSRLLDEADLRLLRKGVSEAYLFTSRENGTSEFYEKNGYVPWTTMTMMGKMLGEDRADQPTPRSGPLATE